MRVRLQALVAVGDWLLEREKRTVPCPMRVSLQVFAQQLHEVMVYDGSSLGLQ
jgi:hypothetical protein